LPYQFAYKISKAGNHISTLARQRILIYTRGLIENILRAHKSVLEVHRLIVIDFQTYLMKSKVESAVYDFKQGLYDLGTERRTFRKKHLKKK
jgi:hypothetical protein